MRPCRLALLHLQHFFTRTCYLPTCTSSHLRPAVFALLTRRLALLISPAVFHFLPAVLQLQHLRPADQRLLHLHGTRSQHRTAAPAARRRPVQTRCPHASSSPSRTRYARASSSPRSPAAAAHRGAGDRAGELYCLRLCLCFLAVVLYIFNVCCFMGITGPDGVSTHERRRKYIWVVWREKGPRDAREIGDRPWGLVGGGPKGRALV